MTERLNANAIAPEGRKILQSLQAYVEGSGLEKRLLEIVKVRASQINGCAFCLALHMRDAVAAGETHERLQLLHAWRETDIYSPRERAALAWTDAVTEVSHGRVPDSVFAEASQQFTERELVDLTYAVIAINAWNRLAIAFRKKPAL
jgi:AhpD family alkylhydroperoxidase